jgi:hypothetical protein
MRPKLRATSIPTSDFWLFPPDGDAGSKATSKPYCVLRGAGRRATASLWGLRRSDLPRAPAEMP